MAWKPYLSGEVIILNKSTLNKLIPALFELLNQKHYLFL